MDDKLFYLKELKSDECQCGRAKKPKNALCFFCYSSLPEDMKADLWKPIGRGYEAAYEAAVKYLN